MVDTQAVTDAYMEYRALYSAAAGIKAKAADVAASAREVITAAETTRDTAQRRAQATLRTALETAQAKLDSVTEAEQAKVQETVEEASTAEQTVTDFLAKTRDNGIILPNLDQRPTVAGSSTRL